MTQARKTRIALSETTEALFKAATLDTKGYVVTLPDSVAAMEVAIIHLHRLIRIHGQNSPQVDLHRDEMDSLWTEMAVETDSIYKVASFSPVRACDYRKTVGWMSGDLAPPWEYLYKLGPINDMTEGELAVKFGLEAYHESPEDQLEALRTEAAFLFLGWKDIWLRKSALWYRLGFTRASHEMMLLALTSPGPATTRRCRNPRLSPKR